MPARTSSPSTTVRKRNGRLLRGGDPSVWPNLPRRQKVRTPDGERAAMHTAHQFDVSIYCDGACEPNPGNAGSGIVVYRKSKLARIMVRPVPPYGDQQHRRIGRRLSRLTLGRSGDQNRQHRRGVQRLGVRHQLHSQLGAKWEKKGWKKPGGEIKNLEIIQDCYAIYRHIERRTDSHPRRRPHQHPKATSSPTVWRCSPCSVKKNNFAYIGKQWIFRRCSRCARGERLKTDRSNDLNSLHETEPLDSNGLNGSESFDELRTRREVRAAHGELVEPFERFEHSDVVCDPPTPTISTSAKPYR